YPEKLNLGDWIGVTAPSSGFRDEVDKLRFENAIRNLEKMGYRVKTTSNCQEGEKGRSSPAKQRVSEFMELYQDPEVKAIIFLGGGDFACQMLEYLDFEEISKLPPKWIQGYSDCTNLTLTFNTLADIASIYGPTFKSYGMTELHPSLFNSLRLMQKEEFVQNSYEKCEKRDDGEENLEESDPYAGFDLTEEVKWINLRGEEEISFRGRVVGGCIDLLREVIIGSKFDKLKEFCEKYKEDGIVWILEEYEGSTPETYRTLWRMKNMGLFENCKGIIFGRPLTVREDYEISYKDAIEEAIGDLQIPVILDADIGHLAPQIPVVTGAILEVTSKGGKGTIKNILS
ncbi:MAG: LD-carboxypeptidase, partial [Clostridia bacterium]|nr:LD-carboxypeptidase [Clostridia bacterium]